MKTGNMQKKNDGIVELNEYDILLLFEFNPTLENNAADYHDLVTHMTIIHYD